MQSGRKSPESGGELLLLFLGNVEAVHFCGLLVNFHHTKGITSQRTVFLNTLLASQYLQLVVVPNTVSVVVADI
jgi:hypothetical protein